METVDLGCYGFFTNYFYDGICDKIVNFCLEAGKDRYNRKFNIQPLIKFAIDNDLTEYDADIIYKLYVYNQLMKYDHTFVDNIIQTFEII